MEVVLKTQGVTKWYGTRKVVDKVNMTIHKGDIYGFIGSNGAGKTTFIRCILGLVKHSGTVEILGQSDKAGLVHAKKKIGAIVETPALGDDASGFECLKTHALLYGIKDENKIKQLLDFVGLADAHDKKVKYFSLGMKQRMAIAQALINDPEILILDEPTNGMDPQGIIEMREFLKKLSKTKGTTILISSHILAELQQLATRIGIIDKGILVDEFRVSDIKGSLESYYLAKVGAAK